MSVYLSVRYHISQTTRRTFTKSSLHLVCGRGSVLHMATLQHVMYLCLCYVPCLLKMAVYLTAAAVCGGFAAVGPADMISIECCTVGAAPQGSSTARSSKRALCHVYSSCRKLNTDLLQYTMRYDKTLIAESLVALVWENSSIGRNFRYH